MRNSDFTRTFSTREAKEWRVLSIRFEGSGRIFIWKPYKTPHTRKTKYNVLKNELMKGRLGDVL